MTELFGGRGHDFNVMDEKADKDGGMLVIATSVPDEREWTQWKGRTARQDKSGQYMVILRSDDPCVKRLPSDVFKRKSAEEKIQALLAQHLKLSR